MTFDSYFRKTDKDIDRKKSKLNELQHRLRWDKDKESLITLPSQLKKIALKIENSEKNIEDIEKEIMRLQYLRENPDELVKEYLQSIPANRKKIDLNWYSPEYYVRSLSIVPDLSRFTELRELDLSLNIHLSSGFDRLPITLEKIICYKTEFSDVSWLLRLTNLTHIDLYGNIHIRELPDLSEMKKLKDLNMGLMHLVRLPNLPENQIKKITLPVCEGLEKYFSRKNFIIGKRLNYFIRSNKYSMLLVQNINRINQFDTIREELLENAAKILLNPSRIERLLNQSYIDLDSDSDWSDLYDFQKRRVYAT